MVRESRRYLGLDLAGAKNQKTALAVLEYYPKEHKIFLLDIHERISVGASEHKAGSKPGIPVSSMSADEALLCLLHDQTADTGRSRLKMGVNVPLELPPCLMCPRKNCKPGGKCTTPAVRWMREITRKAARNQQIKILEFTPYTQRPVELWVRYQVLPKLQAHERFEIDETLGGNKAPLTARMIFLKRHLKRIDPVEVWPKLSVAVLAAQLGLAKRVITSYRKLEEGVQAREEILEALAEKQNVFIYERDIRTLALNLSSFDAFICAYTALLSDIERTVLPPSGFPISTGWVHYPELKDR